MKTIRTIADIERLKEMGRIPLEYIKVIESEFVEWFEADGGGESTDRVRNATTGLHVSLGR